MTAQIAAQPNSMFSAAIAQINGAGLNGEELPEAGNPAGAASFRMLIDSMLCQNNGSKTNDIADQTFQGGLIDSMLGQNNGSKANAMADQSLQEVLAEEGRDDIAAELAAIMPFLAAFGLAVTEGRPPAVESFAGKEPKKSLPHLLNTLTARGGTQENSAATANTAGVDALAAHDPADAAHPQASNPVHLLLARHSGGNRQEAIGAAELAFRQPEQPGQSFASIQQAMQSAVFPIQSSSPTASHTLPTPVGADAWGEDFANRVVWMATRLESRADLVLTPPQMGRIEVSLSITGDQATANFVSGNPAVREALEAALPRLREVLADAGIQLGQTQVGAGNPQQTAQHEKNGENSAFGRPSLADESRNMSGEDARSGSLSSFSGGGAGRGLVDVFA